MPQLTDRDLRAALRCLAAWDVRSGLEAFATSVTAALPDLISSDVTVFASADIPGRTMRAVETPSVTSRADRDTYIRLSLVRPNPILSHFAMTRDPEARRMTDFISQREFRRLPLYAEFYRKLGLQSVLSVLLNDHPTSLPRAGSRWSRPTWSVELRCEPPAQTNAFDGITLNRGRRDFDERERTVLTLLRPHLLQAYRTAAAVDRLRADLALSLHAIETAGLGLVVLSGGGRVRLLGPRAEACLRSYFGPRRRTHQLPESLDRWVRHHDAAAGDSSRLPPLRTPFVVARDDARLVVHLVAGAADTLLLLEEQATRAHPARLATPALSSREADVLAWVAEGKTTPEIATILGLSPRTVQTYLERVFGKLGVQTRAAAIARTLPTDTGKRPYPHPWALPVACRRAVARRRWRQHLPRRVLLARHVAGEGRSGRGPSGAGSAGDDAAGPGGPLPPRHLHPRRGGPLLPVRGALGRGGGGGERAG